MARKPRSEWSDAYRRRIERGERRGFSKQRARGHGTPRSISGISEYQVRKERAIARGALTPVQRAFIRRQELRHLDEVSEDDEPSPMRARFLSMSQFERNRVITVQHILHTKYRSKQLVPRRTNMETRLAQENIYPQFEWFDQDEEPLFFYH